MGDRRMSEPMTPWYVSLIIAWAPFIVLIWIGWWCGHQVRRSLTRVRTQLSHQITIAAMSTPARKFLASLS